MRGGAGSRSPWASAGGKEAAQHKASSSTPPALSSHATTRCQEGEEAAMADGDLKRVFESEGLLSPRRQFAAGAQQQSAPRAAPPAGGGRGQGEEEDGVLPPFHFELLHGGDRDTANGRSKVVLLHGWLQDMSAWAETARGLQRSGEHDVLLVDFYSHGRSPGIYPFHRLNVRTLVRQVRAAIECVGWQDEVLAFGGLSLGGAVSLLYTRKYPDQVASIVLVASAGMAEPSSAVFFWATRIPAWIFTILGYMLMLLLSPFIAYITHLDAYDPGCARARTATAHDLGRRRHYGGKWFHWVEAVVLFISRCVAHHRLVWDTPRFCVPPDTPTFLRERGIKLSMVWGAADLLHTAQVDKWADGRNADKLLVPHWDHTLCCTQFDQKLKIYKRKSWWRARKGQAHSSTF